MDISDNIILSCGIVIINDKNQVLGCIPTNKGKDTLIDIPKGQIDEGETPYECAIRETFEETGLNLKGIDYIDCGEYDYLPKKRLHLFKCNFNVDDLSKLKCTSNYFDKYKKDYFPEVCSYEFVDKENVEKRFYKNLFPILKKII